MINIAELLKDAPKGMKLYSPICGHCKLSSILHDDGIRVIAHDVPFRFDKYGRFCSAYDAECLLFPSKDCTWEGWEAQIKHKFNIGDWITSIDDEGDVSTEKVVSFTCNKVMLVDTDGCHTTYPKTELSGYRLWSFKDAKDGDVLYSLDSKQPFIYKVRPQFSQAIGYCCINKFGDFAVWNTNKCIICTDKYIPATKEQRDLLFQKMKEAGYKWDADKKELKKIPKHYDISNFHAGMPVLVRVDESDDWRYVQFSHTRTMPSYRFVAGAGMWNQCIPFEGNEHLLGTTDMCPEEYINW